MMKVLRKKRKGGFTLIELIVVIVIIGILAAIAIPRFATVTDSAKNKAALAEHRIAVAAVEMYLAENSGVLPGAAADEATTFDKYVNGGIAKLTLTTITNNATDTTVVTVSEAKTPVTTTTVVD